MPLHPPDDSALSPIHQIRGAIQEYQTQLIDSVKEDIKHLHDKVSINARQMDFY